jgi:hypothetical protein
MVLLKNMQGSQMVMAAGWFDFLGQKRWILKCIAYVTNKFGFLWPFLRKKENVNLNMTTLNLYYFYLVSSINCKQDKFMTHLLNFVNTVCDATGSKSSVM